MPFDLPRLARAQGRRRSIALRPIIPTAAAATDLAAILVPAARIWAEAIDHIMAGYDPATLVVDSTDSYHVSLEGRCCQGEADGKQCLETGNRIAGSNPVALLDSPDQIQSAIDATAAEFLSRLVLTITPNLRRWALRVEQWHRTRWASAVLAGTGVDLSTVLTSSGTAETVETFIARNVALVRNVSDQAQARISDAVFRGYQQRLPAREVAKELRDAAGFARARAIRVASDQTSKLSAALDRERQAEAGLESFKWRHSMKLHPRQRHKERDGKVYKLNDPTLQGDMPGDAPFCGCRAQAWIPLVEEI